MIQYLFLILITTLGIPFKWSYQLTTVWPLSQNLLRWHSQQSRTALQASQRDLESSWHPLCQMQVALCLVPVAALHRAAVQSPTTPSRIQPS